MPAVSEKKVIGLTGTIGSGKSTVLQILSEWMPATDCDQITHQLLEPGNSGYAALKKAGLLISDENGRLDRKATAAKVFTDPEYKKQYESILHPLILQQMKDWASAQKTDCVIEVPLLFELGLQNLFDETWTVVTDEKTAIERTKNNRHISEEEQKRRRKHQLADEQKIALADRLIDNSGTLQDLRTALSDHIRTLHQKQGDLPPQT